MKGNMKLFLLKTTGERIWDAYEQKLIRSENETDARCIANKQIGDEGKIWEDSEQVSCENIIVDGEAGEIINSYIHG